MTKRAVNLYEFIFGAFFVLKITGKGIESWNWFWVFLPLILGLIHAFFSWVYHGTQMKHDLNRTLQDLYIENAKRRSQKRAFKDLKNGKV